MENSIEIWQERLKKCLQIAGRYTEALDLNIYLAAGALFRYTMALEETRGLDKVSAVSVNGALQQHPAFKMQIDTEASVLRYLKELGLNAEGTQNRAAESDPMAAMLAGMRAAVTPQTPAPVPGVKEGPKTAVTKKNGRTRQRKATEEKARSK